MALNTAGFNSLVITYVRSAWFWAVIIFLLIGGGFAFLWYRKQRRLIYPVILVTKIGNNKLGLSFTKKGAGEFKTQSFFKGLIDYGRESCFKLKDGRKILGASLDDLHDINGRMGFIVYRKEDDPKIVVPISKAYFENEELINVIAPADYRDASSEIVQAAVKETQNKWMQYGVPIISAVVLLISFLIIIFIVQFANHQVDKAGDILKEVARMIGSSSGVPSTTAP